MHGNAINSCGPFSERLAPCACPNSRNKVQQRRCILNLGSVASAMLTASTGVSADASSGPAGMQVGLRGVKPEWHRCRIRDSGPRAFEVPDHVEWVRRIVLPCCLRDYDGRRRGLGCLGIPTASGGALGWAILAGNFTPRMDGWMGYPLPVEHWDYAPSCWGKRGGWLIDD